MQDCSNSIANSLQSCTKPSKLYVWSCGAKHSCETSGLISAITLKFYISDLTPHFAQLTSIDIPLLNVHFPHYWPFVRGIHRSPLNSPHKGQWRGALMFSSICAWTNDWVDNRDAGDVRRHRPNYDVTIMKSWIDECHKYIRSVGKFFFRFEHYETVQWKINRNTYDKNIKINLNLRHKMMQINAIAILYIQYYLLYIVFNCCRFQGELLNNLEQWRFYDFAFVYTSIIYIYIYI